MAPAIVTSFSASLVEFVEASTVILAVGTVRGWRGALAGGGAALAMLAALVAVLGPVLGSLPLLWIQPVMGALMLLFGLRWLRKATLREAGVIPLRDETVAFAKATARLRRSGAAFGAAFDPAGFATAFQVTLVEGTEVVFIVIAIGAGGAGLLAPASLGASAALAFVILLGLAVHRPLARVPENTLKFVVGVMLSAFGVFWFGKGVGAAWPGDDWALPALVVAFAAVALITAALSRIAAARVGE